VRKHLAFETSPLAVAWHALGERSNEPRHLETS
jgi:hypothetical protein